MIKKQDFVSPSDLEKQEHLSIDWLSKLHPRDDIKLIESFPRPLISFIELMNWGKFQFSQYLQDQTNLNKFVHNRIIVDGQFMKFCEENKITVEVLYKDALISWKTDHDFEKFFAQGIFLIKTKELEFLHGALFHKGSSFEDEISFFVIVSEKNYEAYVALRNQFDAWVSTRDRSNLHIRVVEGSDIPYTKDHTWDDLFLPPETKSEIQHLVENFLSSQDFYFQNKIPWKRGILLYGPAGNGKSSIIRTIISEYNIKPVTIVANANDDAVREAFFYAEEHSPSLLYFEDLDSLLERSLDPSTFLNLLDGISAKNGLLVIATANEIKKLKSNITQRPSRFDRKFEITAPDFKMAYIYLKKWFDSFLSTKEIKELAKSANKEKLSYAYLKELYISSMFEALSNDRKSPTFADIGNMLKRLIKDKNVLGGNAISTDKYFS
jgi:AAA+ superfamily predicted ATPase